MNWMNNWKILTNDTFLAVNVTVGQIKWLTCSKHLCVAFMCLFLTSWHLPFNISLSVLFKFTIFAITLQLSLYMLHSCLHSYVKLLQSLLSHCLFVILSFYSVGLSDAARCHYAAVTAGAGAITRHTHHGKRTCLCVFMYLQIIHAHAHASQCLCPQCFWWLLRRAGC